MAAGASAGAQEVDTLPAYTSTALPLVTARRPLPLAELTLLDSAERELLQATDLGTLLGRRTGIFIKDYGPGRLSTLSLHGGSAAQTAVRWAGFDLRSATLGQTDLSLVPLFFIDTAVLSARGNGARYGDGAVSGTLELGTSPPAAAGSSVSLLQALGRYGNYQTGLLLSRGGRRLSARARLLANGGHNDYPYRDFRGARYRLPHARHRLRAAQSEVYWQGERTELNVNAWWQVATREIPPTRVEALSVAEQGDRSGRYALGAKHHFDDRWHLAVNLAYFAETLRYQDSLHRIDSDSHTATWQQRLQLQWRRPGWSAYGQAEYVSRRANLSSLGGTRREGWPALSAGMRRQWARLAAAADLRWTLTPAGRPYWLPNLSLEGKVGAAVRWQLAGAGVYRLPTLNDRYWPAGGDPDLQPERGWEISMHAERQHGALQLTADIYSRWVDDYILWRPDEGRFSVGNAGSVWSRGADLRGRWQWPGLPALSVDLLVAYVRATEDRGEPLIYTPAGRLLATLEYQPNRWRLRYQYDWRSHLYTAAARTDTLPARGLHQLEVSRRCGRRATFWMQLHNLLNTEYEQIANYPLPGLTWTAGGRYNLTL